LFENVSGFMRMYNGAAYHALIEMLEELGYKTTSDVLEASEYGLPQRRHRTIIVGWKKSLNPVLMPARPYNLSTPLFSNGLKLTLMDAISDLPFLEAGESKNTYLHDPLNDYQRSLRENCNQLTLHSASNYGSKMRLILSLIPPGGSVEDLPFELRPKGYFANTYARLVPDQPSPTVTRNFGTPSSSRCIHPFQNRALSTREGARLQGFPDSYVFFGSKTSVNLQIGNAVPPLFGELIAKQIVASIASREGPLSHAI
jgi:DNA (cytosine-5)-methyltransferase 1